MEKYPKKLLVVLLAITLGPAAVLGWVGWRLLRQERSVQRQRLEERLGETVSRLATAVPRGSVTIRFAEPVPVEPADFQEAESLEYQKGDLAGAIALYRARGDNSEALVRLARVLRRLGRFDEALAVYARLESLGEALVDGRPSGLVALEGRCTVLAGLGRGEQLGQAVAALRTALANGRWPATQPAWEFLWRQAEQWSGSPAPQSDAIRLAGEWLWEHGRKQSGGRRFLLLDSTPAWVSWQVRGTTLEAEIAGPSDIQASLDAVAGNARWCLVADAGRIVLGSEIPSGTPHAAGFPAVTHLPWTVYASPGLAEHESPSTTWLFGVLFGLTILVMAAGVFFIARAAARELAVSRLQSDFVAAVSHEFRTPLSSLRQISEMLASDRVPEGEPRTRAYGILVRQTQHLHRLVESLLDFGRLEAGAARYTFEPVDVAALVRECVAAFSEQHDEDWNASVEIDDPVSPVHADRDALARSVSNLLDNAAKYSADSRRVWVSVGESGGAVSIRVRDEGIGIPPEEQANVFSKFVRGRESKERGIRGTGLGLAMVRHIMEAHGGSVSVESTPGAGSTFSLTIPRGPQ